MLTNAKSRSPGDQLKSKRLPSPGRATRCEAPVRKETISTAESGEDGDSDTHASRSPLADHTGRL